MNLMRRCDEELAGDGSTWGKGSSPPSDTERMCDSPPEVSVNLGRFSVKSA